MYLSLVVERPFCAKPGFFRSRIVTRIWWLWFAFKIVHVSEHEYATTAYGWRNG